MGTIIIVDDSAAVRSHLKQTLENAGHKVIGAENGVDGFEKITTQAPDLVIADYHMPGLDGISMLAKVREKIGAPKFPILMLTTETSEKLKAAGKGVGVIAWLNKPFVPEKLVAAVAKILSRTSA